MTNQTPALRPRHWVADGADKSNPQVVKAYRRARRIARLVPASRAADLGPIQVRGAIEDALCGAFEGRAKKGGDQ